MSTEAKPDRSELAAALHEMLDGFREAGVVTETAADQPCTIPGTTPE
jgi:hypothetical protein